MNHDRTLGTERTLPFPPAAVYGAFASAELLASWWGPEGFSNHFETFEFQAGGRWNLVMQGPDGQRYPNQNIFQVLDPPSRIVIRHDGPPYFTLTVGLSAVEGGTQVQWVQVFDDPRTAQAVQHVVVPANEQNLDRLARTLARGAHAA